MDENPFEKMLDRLREKGWQKGSLGGPYGPNCIVGAAEETIGTHRVSWGILRSVINAQYPSMDNPFGHPDVFNDLTDTTFVDIERVLEKAAVKWEEERVTR